MFIVDNAKQKLSRITEIAHLRIFGHEMGEEMRGFLGNLSWSFAGGIFASIAMLFVNVFGGRVMGPEQYGFYGLVLAISQLIMLPALFGMDTAGLHFLSKAQTKEEKADHLTTISVFVFFSSSVTFLLFFVAYSVFGHEFHLNLLLLAIAFAYTALAIFKSIVDVFFRGLALFRDQFFSRMIEVALTVALFIIVVIALKKDSYTYYTFVLLTGYIGFILYGLIRLKGYFSKFRFQILKNHLSYAWIVVLGSLLGTAFNAMDKFIIAKYLSVQELGIYMAYFTASTNLIAQATQIFVNVYFPTVSRISDTSFIRKLDRIFLIGSIPVFLFLCLIIYFIMLLFGGRYGQDATYIVSFGFLASLQIVLTIYSSTIMALSKELYKKYVIIFNVINIFHLIGYFVLISLGKVSIIALVWMFVVNVAVAILFQRWLIGKVKLGVYNGEIVPH